MSKEQQTDFKIKCAEFLGVPKDGWNSIVWDSFDPYNDANDRNKVIEKMEITTSFSLVVRKWRCLHESCDVWNESMEAAQNACIAAVLGIKQ